MQSLFEKIRSRRRKKKGPLTVVGIGQCSWDYLSVVDDYPKADTKKEVIQFEEQGGGPVATALVTLSRLGIQCRFNGITGDDTEGDKIPASLEEENIDVEGVIKRRGASSQIAYIIIGKNTGSRTIFWKRPSGEPLQPEELEDDFLRNADLLLLDGLMKDVSLFAAQKAHDIPIPVMLDAGNVREGIIELAKICDYVIGSEEFAKELGWKDNPETFKNHLINMGFGMTTITLGERGSITFSSNEIFEVPAFPVTVRDTTGAGDVFHGGYIYGALQNWKCRDTITFASAVAAMKCTKIGGRTGVPELDDVKTFLDERGVKLAGLK
jgi:sulfofructose kinase